MALRLFSLVLSASLSSGQIVVKNTDELSLDLVSHSLHGEVGTLHKVNFALMNRGPPGDFYITQTSSRESFTGTHVKGTFHVAKDKLKTVVINNLIMPNLSEGERVDLTVTATRNSSLFSSEMSFVSCSVYFTVGSGSHADDVIGPSVSPTFSGDCPVALNDTAQCLNYQWHLEFTAEDGGSGLRSVSVNPTTNTDEGIVHFSHPNFILGIREPIDVMADISCCIHSVSLSAMDLAGVETKVIYVLGQNRAGQPLAGHRVLLIAVFLHILSNI